MVERAVTKTLFLLAALLSGLGPAASRPVFANGVPVQASAAIGTQDVTYPHDDAIFPNPERGWYVEVAPADYAKAYAAGDTLVMEYVRLDAFRDKPLSPAFLDGLAKDLAAAQGSGVKLVVRFAYNRSYAPDAPIDLVLRHITQLTPLLRRYADVIAVVQAGFIGAYGEWHHSTNDLTSLANRTKITNALLAALPSTRMVEIRTPFRADDIYPTPPDAATAFDGSNASRVGQHNDCFLSNATDGGTYQSPADEAYAHQVTRYTAMGGETCDLGGLWSRNDCPTSLQELANYHWDYLNAEYWKAIYEKWKTQGCYDEISRRLGYRFALDEATAPLDVAAGAPLGITVTLSNTGFGKLYNPRPLELVFVPVDGGDPVTVTVSSDVRRLMPGPGTTTTIHVGAALPDGTARGSYRVYLNLPDASPVLSSDPKYSIRLANKGTWVAETGLNDLKLDVAVR